MNTAYAFIYAGNIDWKKSDVDDWNFDLVEINGDEKLLGHRNIDNNICKVVQSSDGKILGLLK